jgi:steroid 5-alpha reductase family enzyme
MKKADRNALIALPILIVIAVLFALAGSQGGSTFAGLPLFALCVGLAFLIQWLVFIHAWSRQTEKFFDLTGSITYISVICMAFFLGPRPDARSVLLWAMVILWAARLGTYLYMRIQKAGKDARFDDIKPSFARFLNVWTIQGMWVSFTVGAALAAITTAARKDLGLFSIIGAALWAVGFAIEVTADLQKSRFNADPVNRGRFIQTGLWSRSRHPNYFGEILLWVGVAVAAFPVLQGWQLITLISPFFVVLLLTRVSGIPLLEKRADAKWGGQPEYEAYKKRTPVLIPRV